MAQRTFVKTLAKLVIVVAAAGNQLAAGPLVGASRLQDLIFADDFEIGSTDAWDLTVGSTTVVGSTFFVAPISTDCSPDDPGSGTLADPFTNLYYAVRAECVVTCHGCLPKFTARCNHYKPGIRVIR